MWDYSMGQDDSKGEEMRDLMGKAFKAPLQLEQAGLVSHHFEEDPKMVN